MRCEKIRKIIQEAGGAQLPQPARRHFGGCAACRSYERDLLKLRMGMELLAHEPVPEASIGFSARLLRRLEQELMPGVAATEFFESAGRRVVAATLVLVFSLLLAMILPPSGPVRHRPNVESYWRQPEAGSATAYPLSFNGLPAVPALVDLRSARYRWNHGL